MEQEESKSRFLITNFIKGLLWLAVILVAFIFTEEFIQENFQRHIDVIEASPLILFSIFLVSEIVFGIIPPVLFMTAWILFVHVSLQEYIVNLSILTVLSFFAGVIGYFIGKNLSKTSFYKRIEARYLVQYNSQLKRYGSFLVLVGAVTPVPFSATCMLAGSVDIPFKTFLSVCATRIFYFVVYGWIVWSFPNLFS